MSLSRPFLSVDHEGYTQPGVGKKTRWNPKKPKFQSSVPTSDPNHRTPIFITVVRSWRLDTRITEYCSNKAPLEHYPSWSIRPSIYTRMPHKPSYRPRFPATTRRAPLLAAWRRCAWISWAAWQRRLATSHRLSSQFSIALAPLPHVDFLAACLSPPYAIWRPRRQRCQRRGSCVLWQRRGVSGVLRSWGRGWKVQQRSSNLRVGWCCSVVQSDSVETKDWHRGFR